MDIKFNDHFSLPSSRYLCLGEHRMTSAAAFLHALWKATMDHLCMRHVAIHAPRGQVFSLDRQLSYINPMDAPMFARSVDCLRVGSDPSCRNVRPRMHNTSTDHTSGIPSLGCLAGRLDGS